MGNKHSTNHSPERVKGTQRSKSLGEPLTVDTKHEARISNSSTPAGHPGAQDMVRPFRTDAKNASQPSQEASSSGTTTPATTSKSATPHKAKVQPRRAMSAVEKRTKHSLSVEQDSRESSKSPRSDMSGNGNHQKKGTQSIHRKASAPPRTSMARAQYTGAQPLQQMAPLHREIIRTSFENPHADIGVFEMIMSVVVDLCYNCNL